MPDFPIDQVRDQFPALRLEANSRRLIFLDNPAGTQVPSMVMDAVNDAMTTASSNLGGFFPASVRADHIWQNAHQAMADMLGAESKREIVIGSSMTALTLHLSRSIGRALTAGDEIIVTRMDHEGDVSPWLHMAEDHGLVVKWLPFNRDTWRIEVDDLKAVLTDKTRLLALNFASNLTGSINQVAALAAEARAVGALVYVDAVQLVPHRLVDVQRLNCDFLVCSSYKFYGPHLGILWGRVSALEALDAYRVRCAADELPEKFETGTPQTELLAGLEACVNYFAWVGETCGESGSRRAKIASAYAAALEYEERLTTALIDGLLELPGFTIHGITDPKRIGERVPTVSSTHVDQSPIALAKALADDNICVWSGHNYAYEVVKHLGLDEKQGVLRIGLAHYNTENDVAATLESLRKLIA